MREAKGLKKRYDDLNKNVIYRGDAIKEKYEIIQQYDERNDKLNSMLQWSRPIKTKLQEPIPDTEDVAVVTNLIAEHKVRRWLVVVVGGTFEDKIGMSKL